MSPQSRSKRDETARFQNKLLERGLATERELEKGRNTAEIRGLPLEDVMVALGILTEEQAGELVAEELSVPFVAPYANAIDRELLALFPPDLLWRYKAVPIERDNQQVVIATPLVSSPEAKRDLEAACGMPVSLALTYSRRVERVLTELLGAACTVETASAKDPGAVALFYGHLARAVMADASEIRFEPSKDGITVRYRIDGKLEERAHEPLSMLLPLISRVRVLLDDPTQQSSSRTIGSVQTQIGERKLILEIAILSTRTGDSVLVKLIARAQWSSGLEQLILDSATVAALRKVSRLDRGLVIVSSTNLLLARCVSYTLLRATDPLVRSVATVERVALEDEPAFRQVETKERSVGDAIPAALAYEPDMMYIGEPLDRPEHVEMVLRAATTGVVAVLSSDPSAADTVNAWLESGARPSLLSRVLSALITVGADRRVEVLEPTPALREAIERRAPPPDIRARAVAARRT